MTARTLSRIATATLLLLLLTLPDGTIYADNAPTKPRAAMIPFANYSGSTEAVDSLIPLVVQQLTKRGIELIQPDSLRALMRHKRIRMTGMFSSQDAQTLSQSLDFDLLVSGSIDFYDRGNNPEAGLSVRVFDCHQMEIVWAACRTATGEDYAGMFGIGKIKSLSPLTARVIDELFEKYPLDRDYVSTTSDSGAVVQVVNRQFSPGGASNRIAIIPFDNLTTNQQAGDIAAAILLSELWQQGYQLVEPGDALAALAELRATPRGEVSTEDIAQLNKKLGATLIVTGTIYQFASGGSSGGESIPEIEMSMRLIDAASGKVLASVSSLCDGDDNESFFGTGREYSLGKLTQQSLKRNWKSLIKQGEKRLTLATKSQGR